jgi:hypothetical protein
VNAASAHSGPPRGGLFVAGAVLLALTAALPARADRPFVTLTSAAAEEDDERSWSVSSWLWRDRGQQSLALSAEYAFEPTLSVEFGIGRTRARDGSGDAASDAEVEVKYLFNHIARDGWGAGIAVGTGADKGPGQGWRGGGWHAMLPLSLQAGEDLVLHLNAGVFRDRGARRETFVGAGGEWNLTNRWTAFAEASRAGESRFGQVGLRWWVKREKVALDLAATQRRDDGTRQRGAVFGVAFYDL